MQDQPSPLTPAEQELEAALHALTPSDHHLDRDALMFKLGRASLTRSRGRWQMAAAAMLMVAAASWSWPALLPSQYEPQNPGAQPRMADTRLQQPPTTPEVAPARADIIFTARAPAGSYLDLRNQVLARGIDALPDPAAISSSTNSHGEFDPLIQWPDDQRPPSMWLRHRQLIRNGDDS